MKSAFAGLVVVLSALSALAASADPPAPQSAATSGTSSAGELKPPDDWSRLLPDLMPAVETCLKKTPAHGAVVTKAWPMDRGMVGVRIRGSDNRRWECVAPAGGEAANRINPVTNVADVLPGEGSPLFVYGPKLRLPRRCDKGRRVLDHDGHPLGWLCYRSF